MQVALDDLRGHERAGVAALHLEDQTFPKRCGHYDDKSLIPATEMAQKLRAARDSATDADLVLIARTDALAVEGLDAAIERARVYAAAGADVIFVEAPVSIEQIETIARRVPQPKLINMFQGGKTPLVPVARLKALGYQIVIIPSDLQRAAIRLEAAEYDRQLGNSAISPEVYKDLQHALELRRAECNRRPPLRLGLKLAAMIGRVPLFAGLNATEVAAVGKLLRARVALPGQKIVARGERGDAMYFIAAS